MHRGYNNNLPAFLDNRPRLFVENCKQKIKLASDIGKTDIKTTDIPGVFQVKSESLSKTWYRVQFGNNDGERPSCECRAWQRSRLLCKHFFAVFNHYPEWNWENLPEEYRESPFITLDSHLLNGTECPTQPSSIASPEVTQDSLQSDEPLSKRRKCSSENDPTLPQAPILTPPTTFQARRWEEMSPSFRPTTGSYLRCSRSGSISKSSGEPNNPTCQNSTE